MHGCLVNANDDTTYVYVPPKLQCSMGIQKFLTISQTAHFNCSEQRGSLQSRNTVHQLPQARSEASLPRAKTITGFKSENPSEAVA